MSKKLTFTFNGTDYTLEFTRRTVMRMEEQGFNLDDLDTKPLITCSRLFAGAFMANHPFARQSTIDEIFDAMPEKKELLQKLGEMYHDPIDAFVANPEESEKNVEWTANW